MNIRNKKGQFIKGLTPWNKGTQGIMKANSGSFKKGDNIIPLEKRFWDKVNKTRTCWLWAGSLNNKGYGRINVGGKVLLAHRVSYEMEYGLTRKDIILHICDEPKCVNPKHLRIGSYKDNTQDMYKKGRACIGEERSQAKLTWEKVDKIRSLYPKGGWTHRGLAKKFGISSGIITEILNNKRWIKKNDKRHIS